MGQNRNSDNKSSAGTSGEKTKKKPKNWFLEEFKDRIS